MDNIPLPLISDIGNGRCVPFIGAGFSMNAKLPMKQQMPDWAKLTELLANEAGISRKLGALKVASYYEKIFGRVQLIESIRQALFTGSVQPGYSHKEIIQLPFDTIYTTNFDSLLEDACITIGKPFRSLVGELQMPFHGGQMTVNIVKMHGDFRHEEHMIITLEDYAEYLNRYPVISTHLSSMLITKTPLFIGYSLSDPDFKLISDVVKSRLGRFQRMSYLVQFNQSKTKIGNMLKEHLHVINIRVSNPESRDEKLADFFKSILNNLDIDTGKRLRSSKPEIFEKILENTIDSVTNSPDYPKLLLSWSNLCFVLMPFKQHFDKIYKTFIEPTVLSSGLECMRADQVFAPGSIIEQIRSAIQQSRLCIADVSGQNPNVLYELGIAIALGKPTVILAQNINDIPFDIRHLRTIEYGEDLNNIEDAKNKLLKAIEWVLGEDRLVEAQELINKGMFRAAVALLGVLLEHRLKKLMGKQGKYDTKMRDRFGHPISGAKMAECLFESKLISQQELMELRRVVHIRNQAVHDLHNPSKESTLMVFEFIKKFIKKYI